MGNSTSILCLGDSITAGDGGSSYSLQLPIGIQRDVNVTKEGYPGFGVRDLKDRLAQSLKDKPQDLVCFMAGTNDLLGTPAEEILTVLQAAWRLAISKGSRVLALSVLETTLDTNMRANQEELNRLIRKAVLDENDERLVFYDACGSIPTQESRPDLWKDEVHPTPAGYKILGKGIALCLNKLLISLDAPPPKARTLFRPCIDIHSGVVKQIVGGTLSNDVKEVGNLQTNYVSEHPASYYAELYKLNKLEGGHVIMLGQGCTEAAKSALQVWPGKLQVGGGINDSNAVHWLESGAEKVILTSWLFPEGFFSEERLELISRLIGPERLVVDLSCRLNKGCSGWTVAMNKWQTLTDLEITRESLSLLAQYCSEFLIHAADVEGLQKGVDQHLVEFLGLWAAAQSPTFPITYAGGARSIEDLKEVDLLSAGYVDLTIGSALDIFGGSGATLKECIEWNQQK